METAQVDRAQAAGAQPGGEPAGIELAVDARADGESPDSLALANALKRLHERSLLPAAVRHLAQLAHTIDAELAAALVSEVPAFSASRNPQALQDMARHGPQHTQEILRLLDGGEVGDFEFVRDHARRRAEQRFPIEATLHAYRCGHKVFAHKIREAVLSNAAADEAQHVTAEAADFAIEYTNTISTRFTAAYLEHYQLLADVAGDRQSQLLSILLDGFDESDGRVDRLLRDEGYLSGSLNFCVALCQSQDPAEMLNPERARRLLNAVEGLFRHATVRCLVDIRHHKVAVVFSDVHRQSGWTAPRESLAQRVAARLSTLGSTILCGISGDVYSTARMPTAHQQALCALESASLARRVVGFCELSVRGTLLHFGRENLLRALPVWSEALQQADDKAQGALSATIQAYASADMNALCAARMLSIHPNTLYARCQKIRQITGIDLRRYEGLTDLLLVCECRQAASARGSSGMLTRERTMTSL